MTTTDLTATERALDAALLETLDITRRLGWKPLEFRVLVSDKRPFTVKDVRRSVDRLERAGRVRVLNHRGQVCVEIIAGAQG